MKTEIDSNFSFDLPKNKSNVMKVMGVGGGGSNAVNHMYKQGIKGVDFVVCNTDSQALEESPVPNKIQLGVNLTEGLGAGANPEIGKLAALESYEELKNLLETQTKMLFITAGMGGGTGTGAAPIIAEMAKEFDILTVGIVTIPFNFEGKNRELQAVKGLEKLKRSVVRTSLQGKIDHLLSSHLTELALNAAEALVGEEGGNDLERLRIKRVQVSGGKALDSKLVPALFLAKTRVDQNTPQFSKGGGIAILDGALENQKLELEAQIEVNDLGVMKEFHERDNNNLQNMVDHLCNLDLDVLIVRDGIADEAISMLTKVGITAYRRFERDDLERLSRITGADIIRNVEKIEERNLGNYSSRSEENIGSINYTKIEADLGGAMTVIFRGSTPEIRDEVSRAFDDALGVSHRLSRENRILPGGGATQTHLARKLREFSTTQSGREQMAIEAYAAALEIVPRTLAKNAGYDPIDTLLSLSAAQSKDTKKGGWIGINGNSGEVMDMYNEGIFDPIFVAKHAISGATDSAISVLRIDDVLWAKQGPETPDWSNQIDDN